MGTQLKKSTITPVILLFTLSLIWGASFILIKKGLTVFSPLEVMCIRALIASILLMPLAVKAFKNIERKKWKYVLVLGIVGNLLPAYLFAKAEMQISSSMAGILNALTPIFTLIFGVILFKVKLINKQILGICIGFLGTALIIYTASLGKLGFINWYAVLIVLATICYSISTNTLKYYFNKQAVADVTIAQISVLGIPSLFFLLFSNINHSIQKEGALKAIGYLSILAVFGTILGMWIFNRIVQLKSAVFAISVTYFIPFIAITFGFFNKEVIQYEHLAGLILIVGGVFLINQSNLTKQ